MQNRPLRKASTVTNGRAEPIDPALWEIEEMRTALAERGLQDVYRILNRHGVSQGQISRATGQSKGELYEILHHGRQVQSYDVFARVAVGLGIPPGYMGLAYDTQTATVLGQKDRGTTDSGSEPDGVDELLELAASLTVATGSTQNTQWGQPPAAGATLVPTRIGNHEIAEMIEFTAAMRALDYKHGGGACHDAIVGQLRASYRLLNCDATEATKRALLVALADQHNLAAWTSADVGVHPLARQHSVRALRMAFAGQDSSLAANVLYRLARLHLHCGITESDPRMYKAALKFFGLGRLIAEDAGCPLTVAVLCANTAWVYALTGDREQMLRYLGRAEDEYARATRDTAQPWVRFFGPADLSASIGVALTAQPDPRPCDLTEGINHLTRSIELRGTENARSRCFELTAISTAYLLSGSRDLALHAGIQAVTASATVNSVRTRDRLTPLRTVIGTTYPKDSDFKDLSHSITNLQERR